MAKIFKKLSKQQIKSTIRKILLTLIGTFLLSLGSGVFLVPFDIITGGITGIGIIFNKFGILTVDIWSYIISWGLFFVGLAILGPKFSLNTLISTIFYPVFLSLILRTNLSLSIIEYINGIEGSVNFTNSVLTVSPITTDMGRLLVSSIIGGMLVGAGLGIVFLGGGSTGGIDIIAFIIQKYTGFDIAFLTLILDGLIILIGFIINLICGTNGTEILVSFIGVISSYVTSFTIQYVSNSLESYYVCDVITSKKEEINQFVQKELDRTVTYFEVVGGYTKEKKDMVRIVFSKREYTKVKDAIAKIDKDAFITFSKASVVAGEGFEKNIASTDTFAGETKKFLAKNGHKK